jgi:CobQ/CobB/MinD/ParA nucleotide binding domain.
MIVSVCHTKGGVGKSALATQLAVIAARAGRQTLLIDADSQPTTSLFAAARREAGIDDGGRLTTVQIRGRTAHQEIRALAAKHDLVVVDVGGRDSPTLRSVLIATDVAVIPLAARGPELWALDDLALVLDEVRSVHPGMRAVAVVNRADAGRAGGRLQAIGEYLSGISGIEAIGVSIGNRMAIADAVARGLGVEELKPVDAKAVRELRHLHDTIITLLQCLSGASTAMADGG